MSPCTCKLRLFGAPRAKCLQQSHRCAAQCARGASRRELGAECAIVQHYRWGRALDYSRIPAAETNRPAAHPSPFLASQPLPQPLQTHESTGNVDGRTSK